MAYIANLWLIMFPKLELMNMSRGSRAGLSSPAEEMWLKVICVEITGQTRHGSQTSTRGVTVISSLTRARTMTGWDLSCRIIFIQLRTEGKETDPCYGSSKNEANLCFND